MAPSRLIRPRPIDCDAGHDCQTVLSRFFEEEKHIKKRVFSCPASSGDLHPKRSSWPDFRDRGVSNRVTNAGKKNTILGQASFYIHTNVFNQAEGLCPEKEGQMRTIQKVTDRRSSYGSAWGRSPAGAEVFTWSRSL